MYHTLTDIHFPSFHSSLSRLGDYLDSGGSKTCFKGDLSLVRVYGRVLDIAEKTAFSQVTTTTTVSSDRLLADWTGYRLTGNVRRVLGSQRGVNPAAACELLIISGIVWVVHFLPIIRVHVQCTCGYKIRLHIILQ